MAGFLIAASAACAATSLTQHGITWTFDRDYTSGQFANGDHWVVGPVKITNISPRTSTSGGVTMHGSMINPAVNGPQGYDSRIKNNTFSSSHNVAANLPLTVQVNSSLLSSISNTSTTTGDNPQINTIAILTVLPAAAPSGSFRPAPVGTNKTLSWNKSHLDYSKLRSLPAVSGTPSLASVEACFERPWIEQGTTWVSRYMHPSANQPSYGREIAHTVANGLLSLQLNYSNAQKEKLLVRMVQYGIDIYGSARLGGIWIAGGGHNHGRKMPMLLAGAVLKDANILAYADGKKMVFQEDRQTWHVTQGDVGRTLYTADGRPRVPYIQSDVGIAEWGEKHFQEPIWDGRNWDSYYRVVVGASITGHALTARLMGLTGNWNWPAFFDYIDRYYKIEAPQSSGSTNEIKPFVKSMWEAYRNSGSLPSGSSTPPPTTSPTPTPTPTTPPPATSTPTPTPVPSTGGYTLGASWMNVAVPVEKAFFTVAFDVKPLGTPMDAFIGLAPDKSSSQEHLATTLRFSPSGIVDARDGDVYRAVEQLRYEANKTYRVQMDVNPSTRTYTVKVTPQGGATVKIAQSFKFRSAQKNATSVSQFSGFGTTGKCVISNVVSDGGSITMPASTSSAAPSPTPTPTAPTPVPPTPTPTPVPSTGGHTLGASWLNVAVPVETGFFNVTFDVKPLNAPMDAFIGMAPSKASSHTHLATMIRFSPAGIIDVRDGDVYRALEQLRYQANKTYRVEMDINPSTKTYTVKITPQGGATVKVAQSFKFRAEQKNAKSVSQFSGFGTTGKCVISNVVSDGKKVL